MKLNSFEKQDNKGEAVISVERKAFEKALNTTYNYQKKWFNIPGFRKGIVPRMIIENKYGKDIFYDGALQELYVDLLNFIQKEKNEKIINLKLSPFRRVPDDAVPSVLNSEGNDVEIKMPLYFYAHSYIGFENMKIEVEKEKKASKEDIEAQKKMILDRNASYELVNDDSYKAAMGDVVKTSIADIVFIDKDGNDIEDDDDDDDQVQTVTVTIGSGRAWKEFENALIGHSKSDGVFSVTLTFPEDKRLNIFSGKTVRFGIEISEIKTLTPPTMDKLLKGFNLKTEKELDERIEAELNNSNHLAFENDKKNRIHDNLIKQISDDVVCETYVKDRTNESMDQFKRNLASRNLTLDYYCRIANTNPKDIESDFYSSALNSFKLTSALISVSELLKMSCSDDEVNKYFDDFSKLNRISPKLAKENIPLSQVYTSLLCDKAMEHILKGVIVEEKKASSENTSSSNKEKKKAAPKKEKEATKESAPKKRSTSTRKPKASSENK